MRKYFGAAAVVVFLIALALALWGGESNLFESPVSSIPSILIDHYSNETEIYVHGLNDFRYSNMSIRITAGNTTHERSHEDAYFIYYSTSEDNISNENFTLNVTVWNKEKLYEFNGSIIVAGAGEAPRLLTLIEVQKDRVNTYQLGAGNLPWKKLMGRFR